MNSNTLLKPTAILSALERDLLSVTQLSAHQPITEVADLIGVKVAAVRHAMHRLKEKGLIAGTKPFVNLCPLGFTYQTVLFSVSSMTKEQKQKLVQAMAASQHIVWCGEYSGELRFGMTLAVRSPVAVIEALDAIIKRFGPVINRKEVATKTSMTFFPRKYLSDSSFDLSSSFSFQAQPGTDALDSVEHEILSVLKTGSDPSLRQISEKLRIPISTVSRRLQSLQKRSILQGFFHEIDVRKLGMESHVLLLYTRGLEQKLKCSLMQFCQKHPFVTFLVESFGSWDFDIGVECPQSLALTELIDDLHDLIGSELISIRALQLSRELQYDVYPFRSNLTDARNMENLAIAQGE